MRREGKTAHILEAVVNGRFYVESIAPRVLGSNEQVPPREPALPHGSSGFFLIAVRLRSICQFQYDPKVSGRRGHARARRRLFRPVKQGGRNLTCQYD
jgi:hypothetical protein